MNLRIIAMPTGHAQDYWASKPDANGQPAEKIDSSGGPCRHCLQPIPEGKGTLLLAYRPFEQLQPYAETGPIFLCASECKRYSQQGGLPPMYTATEDALMIVRGYNHEGRIQYDAAQVVRSAELHRACELVLEKGHVDYAHIRYAATNCYQFRVE